MMFNDGDMDIEFVCHAKKYSKEEAAALCDKELKSSKNEDERFRSANVDDVKERTVRWYPRIPERCGYDGDPADGCYSYCDNAEKGSFPVWVIDLKRLEDEENE